MDGRYHQTVEDWFRYGGRTFNASYYEIYNREYRTQAEAWTTEIEHQISHSKIEAGCVLCISWPVPEKPQEG